MLSQFDEDQARMQQLEESNKQFQQSMAEAQRELQENSSTLRAEFEASERAKVCTLCYMEM